MLIKINIIIPLEIISEWLIDMTKNKEKIIFERNLKTSITNTNLKK